MVRSPSLQYAKTASALPYVGQGLIIPWIDRGKCWQEWKAGLNLSQRAVYLVAPQGLDPGSPVLIGTAEGDVLRVFE